MDFQWVSAHIYGFNIGAPFEDLRFFKRFFLLDTTIAYMNNQLGHRVKDK